MRMKMMFVLLCLAGCGSEPTRQPSATTASVTAMAAEARAGWQSGLEAPAVEATLDAEARCGAHWEQWLAAIDGGWMSDDLLAAAPTEAQRAAAFDLHGRWGNRLFATQDRLGVSSGDVLIALQRHAPPAKSLVDAIVKGDTAKMRELMQILASCRNP